MSEDKWYRSGKLYTIVKIAFTVICCLTTITSAPFVDTYDEAHLSLDILMTVLVIVSPLFAILFLIFGRFTGNRPLVKKLRFLLLFVVLDMVLLLCYAIFQGLP